MKCHEQLRLLKLCEMIEEDIGLFTNGRDFLVLHKPGMIEQKESKVTMQIGSVNKFLPETQSSETIVNRNLKNLNQNFILSIRKLKINFYLANDLRMAKTSEIKEVYDC